MINTDATLVEKYRATTQFERALEIIAPSPERRAECERDVATALLEVEWAAKIKSERTPAQYKQDLQKLAKKLQAAIKLAAKAMPPEYQMWRGRDSSIKKELERQLKETERAINWTRKRARKGSPRFALVRIAAVNKAYFLLGTYRKYPGLSRGPWHNLAEALLGGDKPLDLFKILKWMAARRLTGPNSGG